MKRIIVTGLLIISSLLKASDGQDATVTLPLSSNRSLRVNLKNKDIFTQSTFDELRKNAFAEDQGYGLCVYQCFNLHQQLEYKVADAHAFNQWIAMGNHNDPTTRKPIILKSIKTFMIEPSNSVASNIKPVSSGDYDVFLVEKTEQQTVESATLEDAYKKRKRIDEQDVDFVGRITAKMLKSQATRKKLLDNLKK